jgi:hypothetical protein
VNRLAGSAKRRFYQKVNFDGPIVRTELGHCWLWTGCLYVGTPYGRVRIDNDFQLAHRVAWFLEYGVYPTPCALHKCDTPLCVRVEHLFEGTKGENNTDRSEKWRSFSKLTSADVDSIVKALSSGDSQREIAQRYAVHQSAISHIKTGERRTSCV